MLKIGDIALKNRVVLAPMAGVCIRAFRLIAKEFGVGSGVCGNGERQSHFARK